MSRFTLTFTPQDTLLFKGHRPFAAGEHSEGDLVFPQPSSFWGALVTAVARNEGLRFGPPGAPPPPGLADLMARISIAGPWLGRLGPRDQVEELWLPSPRDQGHQRAPAGAIRAWTGRPSQLGGGLALGGRALLARVDADHKRLGPAWQNIAAIKGYLKEPWAMVPLDGRASLLFEKEQRMGHVRDSAGTRTVEEGQLYTSERWRLAERACLVAEAEVGDLEHSLLALHGTTVPLGGKGRRVRVGVQQQAALSNELLREAAAATGPRRLLLLTPAVLDETSAQALSACGGVIVGGHPEGGWDFERNAPKPLRRTLAAGSVLLLPPGAPALTTDHLGRDHIGAADTHKAGWGLVLRIGQDGDQA